MQGAGDIEAPEEVHFPHAVVGGGGLWGREGEDFGGASGDMVVGVKVVLSLPDEVPLVVFVILDSKVQCFDFVEKTCPVKPVPERVYLKSTSLLVLTQFRLPIALQLRSLKCFPMSNAQETRL